MSNMEKFAEHIIAISNKNNIFITNLQLQKVMYFSMKSVEAPDTFLKELYDDPFNVWRYGPVVKSVYDKYKIFGANPIFINAEIDERYDIFNDKILELLKIPPFDLVNQSHEEEKWKENRSKITFSTSNVEYSLSDVRA